MKAEDVKKDSEKKNILICGAGQGGHAFAAYAALKGHDVTLYTHTPNKAEKINSQGNKIKLSGIYEGEAQLKDVTTDLESAVAVNDHIFIITDATVHKYYAENMAPHLNKQDVILVSPGIGGSLEFQNLVSKLNPQSNISVTETDTLVYACKTPEIGHSYIKIEKNSMLGATVAASPSLKSILYDLYPQFIDTNNPLMGLDDSPVFHIVGMLKNADKILNEENFNFYIDGIRPDVAEYMEKMDAERYKVAEAMGMEPRTVNEWLNLAYDVPMADLYTMIQNTPPYQNTPEVPNRSPAPKTLFHRYLMEEIPLRAVPTIKIAEILGIETPLYREMVSDACHLTGVNFWKSGRTLSDMGLSKKDINNWTHNYTWSK